MQADRFSVSLEIRHPELDPATLTRELGIEPEYAWRAGDLRPGRGDDGGPGRYRQSYWVAQLDPLPYVPGFAVPLESTLMLGVWLLKRRETLWKRIRAEGATAQFLVVLSGGERLGLDLSCELLSMMAALGLSLSIDVQTDLQAAAA